MFWAGKIWRFTLLWGQMLVIICHCSSVGSTLALYAVDPGSNPGTGRYIVARMTTLNGGPLSLGPIPSGRLKILGDVDNWSSPSLCLQLGEWQFLVLVDCTCAVMKRYDILASLTNVCECFDFVFKYLCVRWLGSFWKAENGTEDTGWKDVVHEEW